MFRGSLALVGNARSCPGLSYQDGHKPDHAGAVILAKVLHGIKRRLQHSVCKIG